MLPSKPVDRVWRRFPRLLLAAALVLAAACGPSAPASSPASAPAGEPAGGKPSTPAELAVFQGSDRQQVLEVGARREGRLTWYTSLAGDIVDRLLEGYKEKYPFMQTEVFRAAENELVTRATQEAQAGQHVFDVIESQVAAIRLLYDGNLLAPYYSPGVANVPDEFKTKAEGNTVESATVRISFISFGYNTTLLPESAVPRTHQDLLNPALSGKMAIAGTTTGKRWLGSILQAMGEEPGKQFLSQFASQQNVTVQQVSGKALLDLIAKGEVVASPAIFRDHVDILVLDTKAPVKWVALEPVLANTGQGALAANAPHPHAALLFLDYLFRDGQKVLRANGYSPADEKVPFTYWNPETGKTTAQIEKEVELWDNLFNTTFRT
jgi:iron(III) transport system substrate-binding protein